MRPHLSRAVGTWHRFLLLTMVAAPAQLKAFADSCTFEWQPGGALAGVDWTVYAMTPWDPDGAGPEPEWLVLGGDFVVAGDVVANHVAGWNGSAWRAFGTGMNGTVRALAILEGQLFAGGSFTESDGTVTNHVARWTGSTWLPLGSGSNYDVRALIVLDGALIAGGNFSEIGGVPMLHVARWDGAAWEPLGNGVEQLVRALVVHKGELFAAGQMTISRWDGTNWAEISWPDFDPPTIHTAASFNASLVVGGSFTVNGLDCAPEGCENILAWDGASWHSLGMGLNDAVLSLWVHEGELYAGGYFSSFPTGVADIIAQWDGTSWHSVGGGIPIVPYPEGVYSLTSFRDELIIGGYFPIVADLGAENVARWDGAAWHRVGQGTDGPILALAAFEGGLVAAGDFTSIEGVEARQIAYWDGMEWRSLGSGLAGVSPPNRTRVSALAVFNDDLIAGGQFGSVDGVSANGIARWDGESWNSLGTEPIGVSALAVFNNALIAGGGFDFGGGIGIAYIGKWDGDSWTPMNDGLVLAPRELLVDGNELIAAGPLTSSGGAESDGIARWNGTIWESIGEFSRDDPYGYLRILALAEYDGELIAGGGFSIADGVPANRIAAWDGLSWHSLGGGFGGYPLTLVSALATFNGELFASGYFYPPEGGQPTFIRRWNGYSWQDVGAGLYGNAVAFLEYQGGLIAAGGVRMAGGQASAYLARWSPTGQPPTIEQSPLDLSVYSGEPASFEVTASGTEVISYQWRKDGQNLNDGPAPGGGYISGSTTSLLAFDAVGVADAGDYDVVVTDPCGSTVSEPAALAVGIPNAVITAAASRRACDLPVAAINGVAAPSSEPRVGGVEALVVTFGTPVPPRLNPADVAIEEQSCTQSCPSCDPSTYAPSNLAPSSITRSNEANVLEISFTPALPNAHRYRITLGSNITSAPNQFIELRALVGDVNSDGRVNSIDRSLIVGCWTGSCSNPCAADIDNNGLVNTVDRSFAIGAWTGTQSCAP